MKSHRLFFVFVIILMLLLSSCISVKNTDNGIDSTNDDTTAVVFYDTANDEQLTPDDAVDIVKQLLVTECEEIICEYDNRTNEIEGNIYHIIHAYTIGDKAVEGDIYMSFTYGWFYVDVLTGDVYTDNYDKNSGSNIVPYIGNLSFEEYYLTEITKNNLVSIRVPEIGADDLIYDRITSYLYDTCGLMTEFELTKSESISDEFSRRFKEWDYTDYYVNIEGTVVKKSDELISITFEGMINYKTAAHPNHIFFTLNFDPATGERIYFEDKYTVNDELYDIFLRYAQDAINSFSGNTEISVENDFCSRDAFINGVKNESSVCVYYADDIIGFSYEVIFAAGGHQEVEIPLSEFEQFLK